MRSALAKSLTLLQHERYHEAVNMLEEAIQSYGCGADGLLCTAYHQLSEASALAGDTERGLAAGEKSISILKYILQNDDPWELAHVHNALALNYFIRGDRAEVWKSLQKCRAAGFFRKSCDKGWFGPPGTLPPVTTVLYAPSLLDIIDKCGVDIEPVLSEIVSQPDTQVRRYPDGTVQIDGAGQDLFYARALSYAEYMEELLVCDGLDIKAQHRLDLLSVEYWNQGRVRSYAIHSWSDRVVKRGENLVFVVPGAAFQEPPRDGEFSRLPITIEFKARLTKAARAECVGLIAAWAESVRAVGIFGEGPLRVEPCEVEFYPRAALLTVDASESGPHTLLWLLLCLLRLSNAAIITRIGFIGDATDDMTIAKEFAGEGIKPTRVSL